MNFLIKRAVETRRKFELIDKKLHRPRGDKFQTGFPLNDSKSMSRYEKQYIGGIDVNNKIYGWALEMGFLAIRRNESTNKLEFGITEKGKTFADIESPIFDKKNSDISPNTMHLSKKEVDYILEIIDERKISEKNLMKFTLEYISQGKNHPDDGKLLTKEFLDKTFPDIANSKKDGSFSVVEANTIRSGVVSRLNELGLIKIIRKGIKSEYEVTKLGYDYIEK